MNGFFQSRKGIALLQTMISLGVSLFLGIIFSLFSMDNGNTFIENIWMFSKVCFFMFGAFLVVSSILLVITNFDDNFCLGFGAALYYGTIIGGDFLKGMLDMSLNRAMFVSFIITSLIGYIVWLKTKQ